MLHTYLKRRRDEGVISDKDLDSYCMGFRDACKAMRSDEVYYEVADAKQSLAQAIRDAANYIERFETDD